MCNCLQMRTPRLLGCVTVEDCEKPARQIAQLSTAQSCDLHVALVELHLFVSAVDSCTFLNAHREFWTRFGWRNRIRHVDPPPTPQDQSFRITRAHAASQSPLSESPTPGLQKKKGELGRILELSRRSVWDANANSSAARMCNCRRLRKAGVPECTIVGNSILRFAFGACRIASFCVRCRQLRILESTP